LEEPGEGAHQKKSEREKRLSGKKGKKILKSKEKGKKGGSRTPIPILVRSGGGQARKKEVRYPSSFFRRQQPGPREKGFRREGGKRSGSRGKGKKSFYVSKFKGKAGEKKSRIPWEEKGWSSIPFVETLLLGGKGKEQTTTRGKTGKKSSARGGERSSEGGKNLEKKSQLGEELKYWEKGKNAASQREAQKTKPGEKTKKK